MEQSIIILKKSPKVKFDETIELAFHLGVDPRQSDQMIRGSVVLPNGLGKSVKVIVFCKGEEAIAAKDAGADYVGAQELIDKVKSGWFDFDVAISTPDMMRDLAKIGRVLGPRGLMPSPKSGTVTVNVKKAITDAKAGKVDFKLNKLAGIRVPVGKLSFSAQFIADNVRVVVEAIIKAKPVTAKGHYIKSIFIASTMGPGIKLNPSEFN
ncbi:MAG: 50S ribosomal protein L1 [Candidatus Omnitrophota bacterium]|nr:MAG: 50S ribosomal protein L1 [Candidatus Omnitrophota bacterium]